MAYIHDVWICNIIILLKRQNQCLEHIGRLNICSVFFVFISIWRWKLLCYGVHLWYDSLSWRKLASIYRKSNSCKNVSLIHSPILTKKKLLKMAAYGTWKMYTGMFVVWVKGQKVQPFHSSFSHVWRLMLISRFVTGFVLNGDHIGLFLPATIIIQCIHFKPMKV